MVGIVGLSLHEFSALQSYSEEQRDTVGLIAGAGIGTLTVVQSYRKENVRSWATEVAAEL